MAGVTPHCFAAATAILFEGERSARRADGTGAGAERGSGKRVDEDAQICEHWGKFVSRKMGSWSKYAATSWLRLSHWMPRP
jgi:hypothetical protein